MHTSHLKDIQNYINIVIKTCRLFICKKLNPWMWTNFAIGSISDKDNATLETKWKIKKSILKMFSVLKKMNLFLVGQGIRCHTIKWEWCSISLSKTMIICSVIVPASPKLYTYQILVSLQWSSPEWRLCFYSFGKFYI